MGQKDANTIGSPKRGFMKEEDIKRIIRKQLKFKYPNWQCLPKNRKKEIAKEITDAVIAGYKGGEISYSKYCTKEYMGQERKENRRFFGLPLNTREMIEHAELSHFRRGLQFSQLINVLVYILQYFCRSRPSGQERDLWS